jgi:hypothetical protein
MFGCLRAAHDQFTAEEFLVVQFVNGAFRLIDGLHGDEGEAFRPLVVPVGHDFGIVHLADAVEELEQIALGRIEGQVADVKSRRRDFDRLRSVDRPGLRLRLRAVA